MTWQAYNAWGGSNHYEGIDGEANLFSPVLSYHRPQQAGTAWLPEGAPRIPSPPPAPGTHTHYPVLDWAYAHGYPKYFAASGWATYERHLVRWLETEGYDVDVITQHDLHFRPELLEHCGPLVFTGHDEYWTREMREHVDAFVDCGGQVARLGGNFIWQVRLSDDGSQQECWKYRALEEDPVARTPTGSTSSRSRGTRTSSATRPLRRSACRAPRLLFVTGRADAEGIRRLHDLSAGPLVARRNRRPLRRPPRRDSRAVCYELDGLDYTMQHGLPYATDRNGIDPGSVEIVALAPATNLEEDHGIPGSQLYVADGDLGMIALTYADEDSPAVRDTVRYGCGVLSEYLPARAGHDGRKRGVGERLAAATSKWNR
ncbi:MAG: DUF6605 domain-containing protein [Ilumatobacteraceae bacterium]